MPRAKDNLAGHKLKDIVSCRWDEKGKVWYEGVIQKMRTVGDQKQLNVKFSDETRWIIIRKGWVKRVQHRDSEAEESDAEEDLSEEAPSEEEEALPKPKKPVPKKRKKGKNVAFLTTTPTHPL
jgi:hypothetical protein